MRTPTSSVANRHPARRNRASRIVLLGPLLAVLVLAGAPGGVLASAPVGVLEGAPVGAASAFDPLHTIDGCSGGRILAPRVPIYDAHPERERARRIGWLRGTHRRDLCAGTVVVVRERARVNGRVWVLVEPIVGPGPGWVHEGFLGSPFPRWKCDWRFEDEALQRCLEA